MIGGLPYRVMPHPAVPSFAFGQEGRKAFVFQLSGGPDNSLYALKKFKEAFRLAELVGICDQLVRFAPWPGLEVCDRVCLHNRKHADILGQYPDLEYAVLMPWIGGSTWYDMVIGMTPLTRLEALSYANATAQVLAAIEEAGLAHCDISAANVIINPNTQRAHLIDVEDLYAPGFNPPASLPAGTEGYAHKTAAAGLWEPSADRFAGAVIIAEMAAWWVPEVRRAAEDEHYFAPDEMQQDSPRYQLMRRVLDDLEPRLAELFEQAWFSDDLEDCPRLKEWQAVISDVHHRERVAGVVADWQPLAIPGIGQADTEPRPATQPGSGPEAPKPAAELPIREAAQQAAQQPPAPSTPIIQAQQPAILTPQGQPPTAPRAPIRVQPSPQTGGPVVEWRPLVLPQPPGSPETERRPIWQPPTEAEAGLEADKLSPDRSQDALPSEVAAGEAEAAPQPEAGGSAPEPASLYEDVIDYYPAYDEAGSEPYTSLQDSEELADDYGYVDEETRSGEATLRATGLFKPVLDLSHIDERNRPHLVWTESPGAAHYILEEDSDPAFTAPREYRLRAGDTRWSPGWLWRRSGRLYYRVRAEGEGSSGPWSDVLRVRIGRG